MASLSIIVPALSSQKQLDETLVSVLENRPPECEVIVVHGSSYVDPYDLGDEVRFVEADKWSLVALFNRGFTASCADYVHFLQPGVEVHANWTDAAIECFESSPDIGSVSPLILGIDSNPRLAAVGVARALFAVRKLATVHDVGQDFSRRASNVLGPTLFAAFYRASALRHVGGFDERFGAMADLECATRLHAAGYRCAVAPECQVRTPMSRVRERAHGFRESRCRERLYWRQVRDQGRFLARLRYPISLLEEAVNTLPRPTFITSMLGRCAGWLDSLWDAPLERSHVNRMTENADCPMDQAAYMTCLRGKPATSATH